MDPMTSGALATLPSKGSVDLVASGETECHRAMRHGLPLPVRGGSGCPESTRQVVRAVWSGGVTKPGGDEVDVERRAYRVLGDGGASEPSEVSPFAFGDLGDGDNYPELCLDTEAPALRVAFPAGLMTDPREDLNPATRRSLSRADRRERPQPVRGRSPRSSRRRTTTAIASRAPY
jgi:ribosomal protein S13